MFSMSPWDHVDRFLAFLSPKMACLDAICYPNFSAVSLSIAHFLKGWPFQYSKTSRWKYLDTFFVIGSTRDIGHFRLRPILQGNWVKPAISRIFIFLAGMWLCCFKSWCNNFFLNLDLSKCC